MFCRRSIPYRTTVLMDSLKVERAFVDVLKGTQHMPNSRTVFNMYARSHFEEYSTAA